MSARRLLTVLATCAAATTLTAGPAHAHGSMQNPLSRVEGCYLEGPEHPKSDACKAAVAAAGTQGFYDWMGVRIGDAAGRHRELIPDGRLCSANTPEFAGLDLPRADWPATSLTPGADFTFHFRATAPHKGTFQLFITNAGYDPAKPLSWSDLAAEPFLTVTDPKLVDGQYELPGKVPAGKSGRQLIYAIWQRSDSPEAFYSCSDVVFDGSGATPGSAAVPTADMSSMHHAAPAAAPASPTPPAAAASLASPSSPAASATTPQAGKAPGTAALAETGTDRSTGLLVAIGAAFLAAGATVTTFALRRRRA